MDRFELLRNSGVSAAMATALCLAISCIAFSVAGFAMVETLVWAAWLGMITLGLSWMGTYIGLRAANRAGR